MKKGEAEDMMPHFIDKWAKETGEPWPPDGKYHYLFSSFWTWLENSHRPYTQFRAVPNARYVAEMWFDDYVKQAWRN